MAVDSVHFSSARQDWATPLALFAALDEEFGFQLDAAATAATAKCTAWFGPDHPDPLRRDAFARAWAAEGTTFLNPPYSKADGGLLRWVQKAVETADAGTAVVMLLPARTDTRAFHLLLGRAELRFGKGRLRFDDGATQAPFPSLIAVVRPEPTDHAACCCCQRAWAAR